MKGYGKNTAYRQRIFIKIEFIPRHQFFGKCIINGFLRKHSSLIRGSAAPQSNAAKNNLQEKHMESKFSGKVLPIFLFSIWAPILLIITLGLATPFVVCTVIRWICSNSSIGGKNYTFKGTAGGLFGRWIL
ncbi:MAG: DUF898 domain-containing protein [Treponema sp.]|nr:DUF898 domain-containing protein [Treponema sp.]